MRKAIICFCEIWFALIQQSTFVSGTRTIYYFDFPYKSTERIPYGPVSPADGEKLWDRRRLKYYSGSLGNTYAGQTEFPWVVNVRVPFLSHLDSVGNLLTEFHVLVLCRTIADYEKWLPTRSAPYELSHYNGPGSIRITFSSMYLDEPDRTKLLTGIEYHDQRLQGDRMGSWALKHERCDKGKSYAHDLAIIGLNRPVRTLPPFVAFTPIWRDESGRIDEPKGALLYLAERSICYAAGWGRSYSNVKEPITKDHKVKIRVYATSDLLDCVEIWDDICNVTSVEDAEICKFRPLNIAEGLICMYTQSPIGAVCDSNRGAPIVCGGLVFGMVSRAQRDCSSIHHKPFLVVTLQNLETGSQALYSGAMVTHNKRGAAPNKTSDAIIMYTGKNCCTKCVDEMTFPVVIAIFLFVKSWFCQDNYCILRTPQHL